MPRLPQPGRDEGAWGTILNDFLAQAHNSSGTLKDSSVHTATLNTSGSPVNGNVLSYSGSGLAWVVPPTAPVSSVAGRTGAIVLSKNDVGLDNADNTSDASKNSATATLTNKTISGVSNTLTNIPQSAVSNLTTDLAGKAATSHTHTASQISDSTATGRSLITASDATAARSAIGAGTSNLIIGTTSSTAKAGDYAPTKADLGLGDVDNTSDLNKPISTATQTALNTKVNTSSLSTVATSGSYNDLSARPARILVQSFSLNGTLIVKLGGSRQYVEQACTITTVRASVGSPPSNQPVIVDVNKNGTTIYTTQANRPSIASGSNTITAAPDITSLSAGDYLTVDIDQVGSGSAGADLVVSITLNLT